MLASRRCGLFAMFMMMGALGACSQPASEETSAQASPVELGPTLEWDAVDGAIEYRVQLWDGMRLLFEETREQISLPVTPVMERSLLGVESAELQVRAFGPDGRQIGEVQRRAYPRDGA
jgi:hypothetical protein